MFVREGEANKFKDLEEHREKYRLHIRRTKLDKQNAERRQMVLAGGTPPLRLAHYLNKIRSLQKGSDCHSEEVKMIALGIDQAISQHPLPNFSSDVLAIMLKLLLKDDCRIAGVLCELLEFWVELGSQKKPGSLQADNPLFKILNVSKLVLIKKPEICDCYFEQEIYNEIQNILKEEKSLNILAQCFEIVGLALENSQHLNRQNHIKNILPNVLEGFRSNHIELKSASVKVILEALRKNIIKVQGNINEMKFCSELILSLRTENTELKCRTLALIGELLFKTKNHCYFIECHILDCLLECLENSSFPVLQHICWVVANLMISPNQSIKQQTISHKLFIRVFGFYDLENQKHYFSLVLLSRVFEIQKVTSLSRVEKQRLWTLIMHFHLIDNILNNIEMRSNQQIKAVFQFLLKMIEIADELGVQWIDNIYRCVASSFLRQKLEWYVRKFQNYAEQVEKLLESVQIIQEYERK